MGKKMTDAEKAEAKILRDAKKLERDKVLEEERIACNLNQGKERALSVARNRPLDPAIKFEVGERVKFGNHKNAHVLEIIEGGKICKISILVAKSRDEPEHTRISWVFWTAIGPYITTEDLKKRPQFAEKINFNIEVHNRDVEGLISGMYHFGYDDQMDYQRGNVWTLEEKQDLVDSMFKNIEIGKIALIKRKYKEGMKSYEVLDGKQRLNALVEFIEGRFEYKGKTFHELHPFDQHHIENYQVPTVTTPDLTDAQKYEYFLALNKKGRVQSDEHLAYVKNLLDGTNDC